MTEPQRWDGMEGRQSAGSEVQSSRQQMGWELMQPLNKSASWVELRMLIVASRSLDHRTCPAEESTDVKFLRKQFYSHTMQKEFKPLATP